MTAADLHAEVLRGGRPVSVGSGTAVLMVTYHPAFGSSLEHFQALVGDASGFSVWVPGTALREFANLFSALADHAEREADS